MGFDFILIQVLYKCMIYKLFIYLKKTIRKCIKKTKRKEPNLAWNTGWLKKKCFFFQKKLFFAMMRFIEMQLTPKSQAAVQLWVMEKLDRHLAFRLDHPVY